MAHYLTIIVPLALLLVNSVATAAEQFSSPQTPHTIRFFFKPLNQEALFDIPQSMLIPYLGDPQKLNRSTIRQRISAEITSGIEVFYAGKITHSDFNGEIIFPRLHEDDAVTLIIIPRASPNVRHGVTVEYITVGSLKHASWYTLQRIDDQEHHNFFWKIERQAPQEKIPPYALVILTEPQSIVLQEGVYHAEKGPHLLLPDIYVTPSMQIAQNAARIIPNNRFFAPVQSWISHTPERYALVVT